MEHVEAFFGDKHRFPGIYHLNHDARASGFQLTSDQTEHCRIISHTKTIRTLKMLARQSGKMRWQKWQVADAILFPKEQAGQVPESVNWVP